MDSHIEAAKGFIRDCLDEYEPQPVFLLFSGGNDSVATTHFAANELREMDVAFKVLHINTGIGVPEAREHVRRVCNQFGWDLLEIRAKEDCGQDYEELVLAEGFPGPAMHFKMYQRLKDRCLEKLLRDFKPGRLKLISGRRQQESVRRMRLPPVPVERAGRRVWCQPFFYWSNEQMAAYRESQCLPESPVAQMLHMSGECLCGAFARPGELAEIEFFYPETGKRIRNLQERVRAAGFPWDWGTKPPASFIKQRQAEKHGQLALLCSSCEARDN